MSENDVLDGNQTCCEGGRHTHGTEDERALFTEALAARGITYEREYAGQILDTCQGLMVHADDGRTLRWRDADNVIEVMDPTTQEWVALD